MIQSYIYQFLLFFYFVLLNTIYSNVILFTGVADRRLALTQEGNIALLVHTKEGDANERF